ncbi:MAG TPA: ribonuclease P protein component [Puia sp.]|nr:ribonuclease P protein component [Puia sp.]
MAKRATWKKAEKLKSRKHIERVFREGKSFSLFPYKVVFLLGPVRAAAGEERMVAGEERRVAGEERMVGGEDRTVPQRAQFSALQAGFGASSRNFRKAVDRNRIKRLGREAYRLQKAPLLDQLTRQGRSMAIFFIYIGKELPDYPTVTQKIGVALQKLIRETA